MAVLGQLTCSFIVGNSDNSFSFPPKLFMKEKVMPWMFAREVMAALMYASLVVSWSTYGAKYVITLLV